MRLDGGGAAGGLGGDGVEVDDVDVATATPREDEDVAVGKGGGGDGHKAKGVVLCVVDKKLSRVVRKGEDVGSVAQHSNQSLFLQLDRQHGERERELEHKGLARVVPDEDRVVGELGPVPAGHKRQQIGSAQHLANGDTANCVLTEEGLLRQRTHIEDLHASLHAAGEAPIVLVEG